MKSFCILESYTRGEIEDQVSEYMSKGWFPYGPVEAVVTPRATLYRVTVMYIAAPAQIARVVDKKITIH